MLPNEFEDGMKKLVTIFNPKGWDDATSDAYFSCVRRWTVDEWEEVVEEAVRTSDWMPKPKRLLMMKLDLMGKDEDGEPLGKPPDCDCCFDGLIQFEIDKGSMTYDRICACTCDAGKRQLMNAYGGSRLKSYIEVFNEQPFPVKAGTSESVPDIIARLRRWNAGGEHTFDAPIPMGNEHSEPAAVAVESDTRIKNARHVQIRGKDDSSSGPPASPETDPASSILEEAEALETAELEDPLATDGLPF